jgi:hypothetical protein
LEVTTIELGWDGKNWSNPCSVLQTPLGGGVGKTSGVVTLLFLLTSFVVYKVWFKGMLIKVLEEGGLVTS